MNSPDEKKRGMNSQWPLASIIILCYNGEEYLRECLGAVRRLDYPAFETIVVDNASTDGSVALVRQEFPEGRLVECGRNLGFAGGNRTGLAVAQGEIVVLLNQDTVVAETWLSELVRPMQDVPRIGIAGCKIFYPDGQTIQHAGGYLLPNGLSGHYGRDEKDEGQHDQLRDVDYVTGAALAVRRSVIDRCGFLDTGYFPAYYEETELCLRARKAGYRVVYVPQATVIHHEVVSSGGVNSRFLYAYHKNRIRFVLKNYNWPEFRQIFLKYELDWFRHNKPEDDTFPLLKAYLNNLWRLPAILIQRSKVSQLEDNKISFHKVGTESVGLAGVLEQSTCPPPDPAPAALHPITERPMGIEATTHNQPIDQSKSSQAKRKILLLGGCPLPFENELKTHSTGFRTWQFTAPLLEDGHEVCLVASRLLYQPPGNTEAVTKTVKDNLIYYAVDNAIFEGTDFIQSIHDSFQPDCIIGANAFPSYMAARLKMDKPIWADLNGHLMTEAQSAAFAFDDDQYIDHFLQHEIAILSRADVISVITQPQLYATLGELGLSGRLNKYTAEYEFVRHVFIALEPVEHKPTKKVLRGLGVTNEDFVILWSGGYNTWADVDTLFAGLEKTMAQNPHIVFVSTGGQIDGHDEVTYPHFLELIRASAYAGRFIMRGWGPKEDVPNYYLESDVGINIDKNTLEGVLGTRNRILDWTRAGLPTLTTNLCELTQIMAREGICYTVPTGDPDALAASILHLSEHRDELKALGERARRYMFEQFSYEKTTLPLRQWAANPAHAPDWGKRSTVFPLHKDEEEPSVPALMDRLAKQERTIQHLFSQVNTLSEALDGIRATRWWKVATTYWTTSDRLKAILGRK